MSGRSTADLSGDWSGIFNYPTDLPATAFLAHLVDSSGAICGTVDEPNIWVAGRAAIGAVVDGRREGSGVRFVKYYEDPDGGYDVVHYDGQIDEAGDEISGRWDIPGEWSGTFIMTRRPRPGVTVEQEVAETVK